MRKVRMRVEHDLFKCVTHSHMTESCHTEEWWIISHMFSTVPSISRRTCTSTNGRTRSSRSYTHVPLTCLTRRIHTCLCLSSCIYERDSFSDVTDHPRTKTFLTSNSIKTFIHIFWVIMSVPWKMLQCIAVFHIEVQWVRWRSVLKCVAVCCSVLQCVAVFRIEVQWVRWSSVLKCVAVCGSVLQCVAVCCGVLYSVTVRQVLQYIAVFCIVLWCDMIERTIFRWIKKKKMRLVFVKKVNHMKGCAVYGMGWLRLVASLKLLVFFAEYRLFYRALLQKRPMILRSLLIGATP